MMESLHWNRSAGPSRGLAMDRSPDKGNSCRPCYDQHPSTGGTDDQRPLKEIGSITPTQCTCLSFLIKKDKSWKQIHCLIWPGQVSHNLRKTQPPFWCSYGKAMIHATTVYRIAFSFREGYLIPTDQHIVWWILMDLVQTICQSFPCKHVRMFWFNKNWKGHRTPPRCPNK